MSREAALLNEVKLALEGKTPEGGIFHGTAAIAVAALIAERDNPNLRINTVIAMAAQYKARAEVAEAKIAALVQH